jgi:tRNA-dihydrouridine synthase
MMLFSDLPKPFFVLAPMDDVTETVFRQIVQQCAPADVYFTEFVNVDGLESPGRPKLLKKLRFTHTEGPLIAQLWGLNPDNFEAVARQVADGSLAQELGLPKGINFSGIDINMGCPAKSEVNNGACSALIKNPELAGKIIKAVQKGANGKLPVSVKTRLGFNEVDFSWHEFLLGHNLAMLTIHFRTRKEMSKVPAHWEDSAEIVKLRDKIAPNTKLVGNGDVETRQHGEELAKLHGLDGIMIGRGVFTDPYVFSKESPWGTKTQEERIALFKHHVTLFSGTWQQNERPLHTLNKFCKVYISGFDGAKELRERIMATEAAADVLELI